MKLAFKYKIGVLLLFFLVNSSIIMQAARGETAPNSVELYETLKKEKPQKGFLKKLIAKKSKRTSSKDKAISRGAIVALIAGAAAFFSLFAPLLLSVGLGIWLLGALFAIIGDIAAIVTLKRIKKSKNPDEHGKSDTIALIGLVLALLAGVLPIILLLIALATI